MTEKLADITHLTSDEHNLRILINHIDDPIWLIDTNYRIVECNNAFKKWISCFTGQELDKGDDILFNGRNTAYTEKFGTCYQLALDGHAFKSVEDMTVNNEIRYTTVTFNPVSGQENKIIGVSCFARDITELRKSLLKIEEQSVALKK